MLWTTVWVVMFGSLSLTNILSRQKKNHQSQGVLALQCGRADSLSNSASESFPLRIQFLQSLFFTHMERKIFLLVSEISWQDEMKADK